MCYSATQIGISVSTPSTTLEKPSTGTSRGMKFISWAANYVDERWRLVSFDEYQPLMIRPDDNGKIGVTQRVRAGLSRWFFEDRIAPVTVDELEKSSHS